MKADPRKTFGKKMFVVSIFIEMGRLMMENLIKQRDDYDEEQKGRNKK